MAAEHQFNERVTVSTIIVRECVHSPSYSYNMDERKKEICETRATAWGGDEAVPPGPAENWLLRRPTT